MELLPAFAGHDEDGIGTTLSGERRAGGAEREWDSVFLASLESRLHLCLVLCTNNDLWGHTVETGVRAPCVGAETVGIYLSIRDGLPDLGKKLLLDMWVDHNKSIANRIANLSNILDIARKTEDISLNLKT